MKKIIAILFISVFSFSIPSLAFNRSPAHVSPAHQHEQEPSYAKWGRLALQETKKRYPQADIIDYLHVGRKNVSPTTSQETFKLWLRQGNREFGVYVRITFSTKTERVSSITFEEVTR